MNEQLGAGDHPAVYEGVRRVVMCMVRSGQLERVKEPFKHTGRFRYFAKRGLDGPIAELDKAYRQEDW